MLIPKHKPPPAPVQQALDAASEILMAVAKGCDPEEATTRTDDLTVGAICEWYLGEAEVNQFATGRKIRV